MDDVDALLELLNSTPVVDGVGRDLLRDRAVAAELARSLGGRGSQPEVRELTRVRPYLQSAVRTGAVPSGLDDVLTGVTKRPTPLSAGGLGWELHAPAARMPAARAVIAWADLAADRPGRLRPCGNDECRRFLLDRTKGGTARWCSMATCGNRMKARRHHARHRPDPGA